MLSPAIVLVVALLVLTVVLSVRGVRVDARDIAWLAQQTEPVDPAVAEVYRRYLRRHRSHRAVGGWLGVLIAVTYGISAQRVVGLSIGQGSPLGDVLFCGLAGLAAGALSAEVYRVSVRPGPAVASLAPHPPVQHRAPVLVGRLLLLLAVAAGATAAVRVHALWPLAAALAGAVIVGMAEVARRTIADRRRPVLSPAAAHVDSRLREFASGAVAHLELAGGALAAAWSVSSGAAVLAPGLPGLATIVVLGLLVVVLDQLHRARPRPPRSFTAQLAPSVSPTHA